MWALNLDQMQQYILYRPATILLKLLTEHMSDLVLNQEALVRVSPKR